MSVVVLALEEFASKRRKAQTDIEQALHDTVKQALDHTQDTGGWREVLVKVVRAYRSAYKDESGKTAPRSLPKGMSAAILKTLKKTTGNDEATVERISTWLATAILSAATTQAASDDEEELLLEWVDMGDKKVRHAHADANGQQRPVGEKFTVGGEKMTGPGDVTVPIELWINCRCTLRPVLASEALTAGGNMPDDAPTPVINDVGTIPWHGVLAPEGIPSGDGRMFAKGSLTNRDLPLPLTWQKSSADGHGGSITVAKIEKLERVGDMIQASGYFLDSPEADEVVGLIGEFGKFGVSVDADQSTYELDDDEETVTFTAARICSASIVSIPAFAEAWVALGHWDEEDVTEPVDAPVEAPPADAASLAATALITEADLEFVKTEDGPGWVTHPVDTDRLRDYWTHGAGAAKIGWGTPGDFNRCRVNLAKYVKPQYLNGYCANRHYDALGFWPGRPTRGDSEPFAADTLGLDSTDAADTLSLVAAGVKKAPAEFFANPNLTEPTPVTITDDGHVFGHIATWGTCHIGYGEFCQTAPHSETGYAYFLTGQVHLDNGEKAAVGPITVGGGHAHERASMRSAMAHYDATSSVVADVTVGEDEVGIWFSGWVRPGATEEQVTALAASPLSGDWRADAHGNMELIVAHAVNAPGFLVPRVRIAASSRGQISLVAAGAVKPRKEFDTVEDITERLEGMVAQMVHQSLEAKSRMAALAARVNGE